MGVDPLVSSALISMHRVTDLNSSQSPDPNRGKRVDRLLEEIGRAVVPPIEKFAASQLRSFAPGEAEARDEFQAVLGLLACSLRGHADAADLLRLLVRLRHLHQCGGEYLEQPGADFSIDHELIGLWDDCISRISDTAARRARPPSLGWNLSRFDWSEIQKGFKEDLETLKAAPSSGTDREQSLRTTLESLKDHALSIIEDLFVALESSHSINRLILARTKESPDESCLGELFDELYPRASGAGGGE